MRIILCVMSILLYSSFAISASSEYEVSGMTADQAFDKGRLTRAQYKNIESRQYLKYAADNNNAAAAFLYAMELAEYKATIRTPIEAKKYLLKAAMLGNRQAMYQLYSNSKWLIDKDVSYWRDQYYSSLILLGRTQPSQAMYELARFHQESDKELSSYYFDIAIGFEHPLALMERADSIVNADSGFFLLGGREKEANDLYLMAAETEYIPAIKRYVEILEAKGRYEEAYQWRIRALERGDLSSLATISKILLGNRSIYDFVVQDKVKAKAYIDLYLSFSGRERMNSIYSSLLIDEEVISQSISVEERKQAVEMYLNYKNSIVFYNHDVFWDVQ